MIPFLFIFCEKGNHWALGWNYYTRYQKGCGHSAWCKSCIDNYAKERRRLKRDAMMIRTECLAKGLAYVKRSQNLHVILENFIGKEIIINGKYYTIISIGLADQHPDDVELLVRRIYLT